MNYNISTCFYEQHKDFSVYTSSDWVKVQALL